MTDSILKCTIKKSAHVTVRLILFAVVAAVFISGIYVIWTLVPATMAALKAVIDLLASAVIDLLASVPWFVYATAGVLVTIFGYSWAWCVAREFTEEDWGCDGVWDGGGAIFFISLFILSAVVFNRVFQIPDIVLCILLSAGVSASVALLCELFQSIRRDVLNFYPSVSKTIAFPGAYLHYRKRMKGGAP